MCIVFNKITLHSNSTQLLPLEHSTSIVWQFFGLPSQDGNIKEPDKKK